MPSSSKGKSRRQREEESNSEGWVGHPLDPIGCLFDTLTDASVVRDENTQTSQGVCERLINSNSLIVSKLSFTRSLWSDKMKLRVPSRRAIDSPCCFCPTDIYSQPAEGEAEAPPPKYQHVVIPGNRDRNESYLTLALEAALIGTCSAHAERDHDLMACALNNKTLLVLYSFTKRSVTSISQTSRFCISPKPIVKRFCFVSSRGCKSETSRVQPHCNHSDSIPRLQVWGSSG